jgi:hypothetical protein
MNLGHLPNKIHRSVSNPTWVFQGTGSPAHPQASRIRQSDGASGPGRSPTDRTSATAGRQTRAKIFRNFAPIPAFVPLRLVQSEVSTLVEAEKSRLPSPAAPSSNSSPTSRFRAPTGNRRIPRKPPNLSQKRFHFHLRTTCQPQNGSRRGYGFRAYRCFLLTCLGSQSHTNTTSQKGPSKGFARALLLDFHYLGGFEPGKPRQLLPILLSNIAPDGMPPGASSPNPHYPVSWCSVRNAPRTFRLDRIQVDFPESNALDTQHFSFPSCQIPIRFFPSPASAPSPSMNLPVLRTTDNHVGLSFNQSPETARDHQVEERFASIKQLQGLATASPSPNSTLWIWPVFPTRRSLYRHRHCPPRRRRQSHRNLREIPPSLILHLSPRSRGGVAEPCRCKKPSNDDMNRNTRPTHFPAVRLLSPLKRLSASISALQPKIPINFLSFCRLNENLSAVGFMKNNLSPSAISHSSSMPAKTSFL